MIIHVICYMRSDISNQIVSMSRPFGTLRECSFLHRTAPYGLYGVINISPLRGAHSRTLLPLSPRTLPIE